MAPGHAAGRMLGAALALWSLAWTGAWAQASDPAAQFKARVEAAVARVDGDPAGAAQALERLALESIDLRRTKPLTPIERPVHRQLFLMRARANLLLLDNKKADESFRELLRIDPLFAGELAPREQEMIDELRTRETGILEVASPERGAHVFVDGIDLATVGETPARISILAGTYEVRLEKPGFKGATVRVSVTGGQTERVVDLTLTRNVPPVVLFTDRDEVEVIADNVTLGMTEKLPGFLRQASPEERVALDRLAASSGIDPQAIAGVLLRNPALDRAVTVRFRRPCLIEETRVITLTSEALARLDPAEPFIWLPDVAVLRMRPDAGTLRITSTPPDADVFVDGTLAGQTPYDQPACSGLHNVRIRHRIGSYTMTVNVIRGRTQPVDVTLKPDLAFLGAVETVHTGLRPAPELATAVDRALASAVTSYHMASRLEPPPQVQRWTDSSTASLVTADDKDDREAVERLLKQAVGSFDAPLMLCAVRRAAAAGEDAPLDLLLFWSGHGAVDRIRAAGVSERSIATALERVNIPADALEVVYRPDLGVRVADTGLPDAALLVVAVRPGSPGAAAGLKRGDAIETVDMTPATATQFAARLRRKQPGDLMALGVVSQGGTLRQVSVPVQRRACRAPVFDLRLPGNGLIAKLSARALMATGPERDLLNFNLALTHMRFGEWRRALDLLAALISPPSGDGVGRGAVMFFRARCYEELGEPDRAVALYKEAAAIDDEQLTDDGNSVGALARYRLAALAGGVSSARQ